MSDAFRNGLANYGNALGRDNTRQHEGSIYKDFGQKGSALHSLLDLICKINRELDACSLQFLEGAHVI